MKNRKGFTLIELLVSISIIAILTALLTANFIGARQRGRDGQRKANLYQLQSALELYRTDSGLYPLNAALSSCGGALSLNGTIYMQKIPCDPQTDQTYTYNTSDNGSTYSLVACLENEADAEKDEPKNSACASSPASFTLTNP